MIRSFLCVWIILSQLTAGQLTDVEEKNPHVIGKRVDRVLRSAGKASVVLKRLHNHEKLFAKRTLRKMEKNGAADWRFVKKEGKIVARGAGHLVGGAARNMLHRAENLTRAVKGEASNISHQIENLTLHLKDSAQEAVEDQMDQIAETQQFVNEKVLPSVAATAVRSARTSLRSAKTLAEQSRKIADASLNTAQRFASKTGVLRGVQVPNVARSKFPVAVTMKAAITNPIKIARNEVLLSHKLAKKAVNEVAKDIATEVPSFRQEAEKLHHSKFPVAVAMKQAMGSTARRTGRGLRHMTEAVKDGKHMAVKAIADRPRMFPGLSQAAAKVENSKFPVRALAEQTMIDGMTRLTKAVRRSVKASQ